MSREKNVTIYDVAERAGVSASTVSRVFSSPARVSAKTTAKVYQAARELGFQREGSSYWEHDKRTKKLAIVVSNMSNPVYSDILSGFRQTAVEHDYSVIVINSEKDPDDEHQAVEEIIPLVDGIAFPGSRLTPQSIKQFEKQLPLVLLNRFVTGHTCIISDIVKGMEIACDYLQELGHNEVLYLAGQEDSWANVTRWRALQKATRERGMKLRQFQDLASGIQGGIDAANRWKPDIATAVIAFNDLMGIGFMRWVQRLGYRVPDDVSVIGIDNSVACEVSAPELTSLDSGGSVIGSKAARSLIWQAENRSVRERKSFVIPVEFTVRRSTGPAPTQ
ncbi:MAG: LacI family transcriptional regulator [Actinomycetaceae bacterium]|nr:LacI family transcriptional regulator [Actinomycetaceae bacterium]